MNKHQHPRPHIKTPTPLSPLSLCHCLPPSPTSKPICRSVAVDTHPQHRHHPNHGSHERHERHQQQQGIASSHHRQLQHKPTDQLSLTPFRNTTSSTSKLGQHRGGCIYSMQGTVRRTHMVYSSLMLRPQDRPTLCFCTASSAWLGLNNPKNNK